MSGFSLTLCAGIAFAFAGRYSEYSRKHRSKASSSEANPSLSRQSTPQLATPLSFLPHTIPFSLRFAVGPMVGQSDHAFRMLTRRYGATCCYTPMIYSAHFEDEQYRNRVIDFDPQTTPTAVHDRPLIVQFAANQPEQLLRAARYVEHICDAIDINLGCPQARALEGGYGSYLLSRRHWPLVARMISTLRSSGFSKPIFCKIRLLDTYQDTLEFAQLLQAAGCDVLAVHGRKRGSAKRRRAGLADLGQIARLKQELYIPVLANGNIRCYDDAITNLIQTRCDGVVSAEGVLANPRLFGGITAGSESDAPVSCIELAKEYLSFCASHPPGPPLHWIADHIVNICRQALTGLRLLDVKAALKAVGRDAPERVDELHPVLHTVCERASGLEQIRAQLDIIEAKLKEYADSRSSLQQHHHDVRIREKARMKGQIQDAEDISGLFEGE